MTTLQTNELIESPFTKVHKGLEVVGNWANNIRKLADGSAEEEIRCACFYFINKKTPKFKADIMTDEITIVAEHVIAIIQKLANEVLGISNEIVV